MKHNKKVRLIIALIIFMPLTALLITFLQTNEQINIIVGQESEVNIAKYITPSRIFQVDPAIAVNGVVSESVPVNLFGDNIKLKSDKQGKFSLRAFFLGIKIKDLTVNVLPNVKLYPGGELIGIKIATSGLIAVGYEDIDIGGNKSVSPSRDAKIEVGDVVKKVNDKPIVNADDFMNAINSKENLDKKVTITVLRKGMELELDVTPVYSVEENKNLIGLWVKDNIAGIGTLTYISGDMKIFGALGHAITDTTSGILVPVNDGKLIGAEIISLKKGKKQTPGEIRGMLSNQNSSFGAVKSNNDFGIFGTYSGGLLDTDKKPIPIALQNEVEEGDATILTTVDDSLKSYKIRIEKINHQYTPSTKSMSIKITDPELLDKTGGIIQGMSGSPILQNGKIVGAVTHVLVNDPTRGYGVFIEWMLENNLK
jgi:stage IV sporulation protein B